MRIPVFRAAAKQQWCALYFLRETVAVNFKVAFGRQAIALFRCTVGKIAVETP